MKAAVIGGGFMGRVHGEALRRLGSVESVPVASRDASAVAEALADPSIDAVHICTPNSLHFPMAKAALEAGKHVLCEKPLATSLAEAQALVELAAARNLRNAVCHNLRYYPMVQQMRAMREAGELGEILVVQGTYSQDWLLYDTDWNWRIETGSGGPSRALADIGSHWCDMAEHVTGLRINEVCADLATFHSSRKRPKVAVETFAGKTLLPDSYEEVAVHTEDFGSVLIRMGDGGSRSKMDSRARGGFTVSQVSAGRKNQLRIEVYGSEASVVWDQERPDELWIGRRNQANQAMIKDPSLLREGALPFADFPGGHSEGYGDTFKQLFRRFYASIEDLSAAPEYPPFADGLRQLVILEAGLASHRAHAWQEVSR